MNYIKDILRILFSDTRDIRNIRSARSQKNINEQSFRRTKETFVNCFGACQ